MSETRVRTSVPIVRRAVAGVVLTAGMAVGQTLAAAPAANAVTVIVPNQYAVVYRCTIWAPWHCRYAYTYQSNPPHCSYCPNYYYRVNTWVFYWA